jgi:hypothetical protein
MEQNEIKEQHKQTFKNKQTKMKTKNNRKMKIANLFLKNVVNCDEKLQSCKMSKREEYKSNIHKIKLA